MCLLFLPLVFAQNNTETNDSMVNNTANWYDSYLNVVLSADVTTLITIIIGLVLVYLLGKVAFKLIKWIIIILAIILLVRLVF